MSDNGFKVLPARAVSLHKFGRTTGIDDAINNGLAGFFIRFQRPTNDHDVSSGSAERLAERSAENARAADDDGG